MIYKAAAFLIGPVQFDRFVHATLFLCAMEATRKPAVCRALLVLLIVVSSAAVSTAQDESCWKDDDHHPICLPEDCVATCRDHGHADGRCSWAWSWRPYCQCLLADCQ
ncbi:hypothetical protein Zm00014a_020895 [Zea mays]|uniref:Knottin scorpion toxin-like domain-containing protein n=2 Tax=Zea mays TaxID=4577 RepID=A0A3L6DJK6_MAIZE|nr:uncharacterized protein LOC103636534 [Zea mays]AQK99606.1 hypothetical protein ZEAMMB73_Zm00001d012468 [Zea mays]PWZ08659.1 hypothetical protein Zm00014a_020895 [Zea mays]|eukprot:XP_008657102.1 uncharacterized protein LOC103636534 [Zea mays]